MIELPALSGDDALGFLAALGIVALSGQEELPALRLGWTTASTPTAVVDGDLSSREELQRCLRETFARLHDEGRAVPSLDPSFPVQDPQSTTDAMRMSPEAMAEHVRTAAANWLDGGNPWPARWLAALAAQWTENDAKRRDVALTPFYAPTGRMTLRGSLWDKTVEAVETVGGPEDALTGWRRTAYDGANFDHRAKRDAAVTTWGDSANQGAPSPTWLAVMAIRFFSLVERPDDVRAIGWQRVRLYPGYTRRSLVWPVWTPLLDESAVRALLAHPALVLERRKPGEWRPGGEDELPGLGVSGVFGSSRATLSQGDGPLGPAVRLWHDPDAGG
jgi:hypothetical protein